MTDELTMISDYLLNVGISNCVYGEDRVLVIPLRNGRAERFEIRIERHKIIITDFDDIVFVEIDLYDIYCLAKLRCYFLQ